MTFYSEMCLSLTITQWRNFDMLTDTWTTTRDSNLWRNKPLIVTDWYPRQQKGQISNRLLFHLSLLYFNKTSSSGFESNHNVHKQTIRRIGFGSSQHSWKLNTKTYYFVGFWYMVCQYWKLSLYCLTIFWQFNFRYTGKIGNKFCKT